MLEDAGHVTGLDQLPGRDTGLSVEQLKAARAKRADRY